MKFLYPIIPGFIIRRYFPKGHQYMLQQATMQDVLYNIPAMIVVSVLTYFIVQWIVK